MASQVDIVNMALMKFGNISIQSISDSTPQARAAAVLWSIVRDELLFSYPWKFAMKRETLDTPSVTEPEFEYDYKYTLPADCLRVWELYNTDANYVVEGGELYCSDDEIYLKYTAQITDVTMFPPSFVASLACKLAAELCPKLSDNKQLRASLLQEFDLTISRAYKLDAIEGQQELFKGERDLSEGIYTWQTEGR
jgi:hypothetical protein